MNDKEDFPTLGTNIRYEVWWRPTYSKHFEPFTLEPYNEIKEVTDMHWAWIKGFQENYPLAEFTIVEVATMSKIKPLAM